MIFGVSLLFSTDFANAFTEDEPIYIGEATVTCNSGGYGRCYQIFFDLEVITSIGQYDCLWTGRQNNYCPLFLVKTFNMIIDYII